MKRRTPALYLLCAAGFLAPLMGGQISLDIPQPLGPTLVDTIGALFSGPQAAFTAWGLIGCLVAAAMIAGLAKSRVVPTPTSTISWCIALFLGALLFSVLVSGYKWVSFASLCAYGLYGAAFYATVALVGRRSGPNALAASLAAGTSLVALKGIWEYVSQADPTWRIFSTWFHPNALAGALILALPLCIAFACSKDVVVALAGIVGSAVVGTALVLTQSKGGYLASAVGLLVFAVLTLAWSGGVKPALDRLLRGVICVVCLAGLSFAVLRQPPAPAKAPTVPSQTSPQRPNPLPKPARPPATPTAPPSEIPSGALGRITNAGATQEQSAGFRILLWKSAAALIKSNPSGWGLNTFRFNSARPGLTTQTVLAHNTYLQLGAEASLLAPLLLLGVAFSVLAAGLRGARGLSSRNAPLRAAVIAAIVGSLAHNMVDSDLYHFGIGIPLFMLLGLCIQLGCDSGAPELLRTPIRWGAMVLPALAAVALLYFGTVDLGLARVVAQVPSGSQEIAAQEINALQSSAPWDGRVAYYSSYIESSITGVAERCDEASALLPTTRYYRAAARAWIQAGNPIKGMERLRRALDLDPNNLTTLLQLAALERQEDQDWKSTAKRLIEVEKTPYYQVRSIPEVVPTETAQARVMLAEALPVTQERAALLREATDIYVRFAELTVPRVKQMDQVIPGALFGDETASSSLEKLTEGERVAALLQDAYKALGSPDLAWADAAAAKISAALGLLRA